MNVMVKFYHKNILDDLAAPLGLPCGRILFFYDPVYFTHIAVYSTYEVLRRHNPGLTAEIISCRCTDPEEVRKALQTCLDRMRDASFIFDLSGCSAMIAYQLKSFAAAMGARVCCADIFSGIIRLPDEQDSLPVPDTLRLSDLIEANGAGVMSHTDDAWLTAYQKGLRTMSGIICAHPNRWSATCGFFQKHLNLARKPEQTSFEFDLTGEKGKHTDLPDPDLMQYFEDSGLIRSLVHTGEQLCFELADHRLGTYLTTFGVWLELQTYFAMQDAGRFTDIHTSVKVDWNRFDQLNQVGNEIDVTAMYGAIPVLISCKMSDKATDAGALNEIYTVSHRISRGYSVRVLVSLTDIRKERTLLYQKAREMGILVFDRSDILDSRFGDRICKRIETGSHIIR